MNSYSAKSKRTSLDFTSSKPSYATKSSLSESHLNSSEFKSGEFGNLSSDSSIYHHSNKSFGSLKTQNPWNDINVSQSALSSTFVPYRKLSQRSTDADKNKREGANPTLALTVGILDTYKNCDLEFMYQRQLNPKRVLTKPSKPVYNEGHDNEDNDLILYVNSVLGVKDNQRYKVIDLLGQGTFGQVARCQNLKSGEIVAVKVIKGKDAYFNQSMMEITILDLLNQQYDPDDKHHIIRLHDTFIHHSHLCLVFELLSVSLYDLLKQNKFKGLSPNLIRVFTRQILNALTVLSDAHIIHADLKPENILLKDLDSPEIKIIDFGSACHDQRTLYTYIQSRFYRSPEVLLGLPYSPSVDMWSVGCILAELFLGLPLFPGTSEYNQLARIVELLGTPPAFMIDFGKNGADFFTKRLLENGIKFYDFKPPEVYSFEKSVTEGPSKRYFPLMPIPDLIQSYPLPKKLRTQAEIQRELDNRASFSDFILGLLNLNPLERWSPQQAKLHPFVTGEPFYGAFKPPTPIDMLPKHALPNDSSPVLLNSSVTERPAHQNTGALHFKHRNRLRANTFNVKAANTIPAPIQHASGSLSSDFSSSPQTFRSGNTSSDACLETAMKNMYISYNPPSAQKLKSNQSLARSSSHSSRSSYPSGSNFHHERNPRSRSMSYSTYYNRQPFPSSSISENQDSALHVTRSDPLHYRLTDPDITLSEISDTPPSHLNTTTRSKSHLPAYLNLKTGGHDPSKNPN